MQHWLDNRCKASPIKEFVTQPKLVTLLKMSSASAKGKFVGACSIPASLILNLTGTAANDVVANVLGTKETVDGVTVVKSMGIDLGKPRSALLPKDIAF